MPALKPCEKGGSLMGGDKVPTPLDKWVEMFEAEHKGKIKISYSLNGMHITKVNKNEQK